MKFDFPIDYIEVLRSKEGVRVYSAANHIKILRDQENECKMTEIEVDFAKNIFAFCYADCLRKLQIAATAGLTLPIINYSQIGGNYLIEFDRRAKSAEVFDREKFSDFPKLEKFAARLQAAGFINSGFDAAAHIVVGGEALYVIDTSQLCHFSDSQKKKNNAMYDTIRRLSNICGDINAANFTLAECQKVNFIIDLYEENINHEEFMKKLTNYVNRSQ